MIYYSDDAVTLHHGDCIEVLPTLASCSVDSIVTDPPYGLEFMGKDWDAPWKTPSVGRGVRVATERAGEMTPTGEGHSTSAGPYLAARVDSVRVAGKPFQDWCEQWARECLRVLKPGGHMLAFGGTRTWHRLAAAVEDAGFEIRDSIAWLTGSGFPKSLNVSRDKRFCQCDPVPYNHDRNDLRGVWQDVSDVAQNAASSEESDLLAPVQRQGAGSRVGEDRSGSAEEARPVPSPLWSGQSSLEGRGNAEATEGQLQGRSLRPLPTGVPADGKGGRLHHGAPPRYGSVDRPHVDAAGVRESHQPQPIGQPPRESGVVPDERGSQARRSWPVCDRCSQPVVPNGLGTALKPSHEPIIVARKPLVGTVGANVLEHGTGALNIDGCRIGSGDDRTGGGATGKRISATEHGYGGGPWAYADNGTERPWGGRWPANVVLDEDQAAALDQQSGERGGGYGVRGAGRSVYGGGLDNETGQTVGYGDAGGASRFFYCAKADSGERPKHNGIAHPTVKPLDLMRWLARLVTPPGGLILEPFAGSGATVEAAILEGFHCVAIEREADYLPLITQRINRRRDPVAYLTDAGEDLGLFDGGVA